MVPYCYCVERSFGTSNHFAWRFRGFCDGGDGSSFHNVTPLQYLFYQTHFDFAIVCCHHFFGMLLLGPTACIHNIIVLTSCIIESSSYCIEEAENDDIARLF